MTAGRHDFTVRQGETFSRVLTYRDSAGGLVDLTGYAARMQVRKGTALLAQAAITLGGPAGTLTLGIAKEVTATLPAGRHAYDLFLTAPGGAADCLLAGAFEVLEAVSR